MLGNLQSLGLGGWDAGGEGAGGLSCVGVGWRVMAGLEEREGRVSV